MCLQKMVPDVRVKRYAILPITELRATKSRCMHLHARMQESSWTDYYVKRERAKEREKNMLFYHVRESEASLYDLQISHLHAGLYVFLIHLFIVLSFLD